LRWSHRLCNGSTDRAAGSCVTGRPGSTDDRQRSEEEIQMRLSLRAKGARPVAALLLTASVLLPSAIPATAADPLILRVGTGQKLATLNPWHSITVADYEIFQLQYEMLVSFGQNLEPVPGFADKWESSADKMTHTFHIREGMVWSDGEPATCEDARWTYQFVLDAVASETGYVGSGYLEPYLMNAGLKTVTCTDPQTLVVTTEFPTTLLTQAYVPILPKHIWSKYTMEQIGNADAKGFFANEPPVVGSGPYTAVQWEPGQYIRFARNDKYWGKRGVPDEIIFQTFSDPVSMVPALKSGELDYVRGIGADQFDALKKEPNIKTVEGFSNGYTYLSFNTRGNQKGYHGSTSALADVKFRDALGYAIDHQKLVDAVFNGHAVPGTTHVPPYHVKWHVEPATPRTFDIAEANRRLDAAGYSRNAAGNRVDKEGKEIVLRLTWPDSEAGHSTDAQFIQGWFKELGIGVDAFVTEEAKLSADLLGPEAGGPANWDMYMWGWTGDPDPMSLLSFFTTDNIKSGTNDAFFSSARYDELFKLQQRATDEVQRHAYIDEMQQIFYDAAAYSVLYYDSELHAYRTDKFGGWTSQPPDSGTPLFGYGYPGYLALTNAALASPSPSATPSATAPSASAGAATPAPSGGGTGTPASGDSGMPILLAVVAVVAVVVVGLVLARRRSGPSQEEE
jgi:peptide/nickel transport system substrate-binding protein